MNERQPRLYSGFIRMGDDEGIAPGMLHEELDWRIGFVAGYCSETNETHSPDDFRKEKSGLLHRFTSFEPGMRCDDCGLRITEGDHQCLQTLSSLKEDIDPSDEPEIRIG